ncbi:MAG TPA: hypothetical protein VGT41_02035 [Candidatus Babeliales bacterium]|nr:hypothetical protein [Candidatus Babeliales bacterium]
MKVLSKWFFIFSVALLGGSFMPGLRAADAERQEEQKSVAQQEMCPVCHEDNMGAGIGGNARVELACKHKLCGTCFQAIRNSTCPMCRAAIAVPDEVAAGPGNRLLEEQLRGAEERNLEYLVQNQDAERIQKRIDKYVLFNVLTRIMVVAGFYKNLNLTMPAVLIKLCLIMFAVDRRDSTYSFNQWYSIVEPHVAALWVALHHIYSMDGASIEVAKHFLAAIEVLPLFDSLSKVLVRR